MRFGSTGDLDLELAGTSCRNLAARSDAGRTSVTVSRNRPGRLVGYRTYARSAGATVMEWEAEPLAVAFYEKMGGRRIRDSEPSAIRNRSIPVMALPLE